jgi:hypothetical protein
MDTLDVGPFLVARSDQLNADDLVGGSVVVQITAATEGNAEQPVILTISGGHKPWKPCKTMLRVMAFGWDNKNAKAWVGRWVRLHRDASVKWGGVAIGGIRIEAMSHIPRNITLMLAETKGGKKIEHRIAMLTPPGESRERSSAPATSPADTFRAGVIAAGFPVEGVVEWLGAEGCDASALNAAEVAMILKDITGPRRGEVDAYLASRRA